MKILTKLRSRRRNDVNIASPAFKANPFPYYAHLRAEAAVRRIRLATRERVWLVTRYDDVVTVLKDERLVKNTRNALTRAEVARQPWFRRLFQSLKRNMLELDPPDHTRLRALVQNAFTPRLVEGMRDRIASLTEELLNNAARRGHMDLIADYALPVPTTVIAEILGVPVADRHHFQRWSAAVIAAAVSSWSMIKAVPNVALFIRYIRRIIRNRRADPRSDLVSALVLAEEAGDTLSEQELVAMIFLLLVAGHETTVNLIGNGVLALLEHPAELAKLRADPALIKPAIEELLRYTSPVEIATERYTRGPVTLGGVTIPRGETVYPVIASANRDERQFANPDLLDIAREPNRHLAFGLGTHFCLGAPLARLEGQIAINALLRRCSDLRLAVQPNALRWRGGLLLRGLEALPVKL